MADNVFAEEDPFSEFLEDQPPTQVATAADPGASLKLLVESSQRQEEFLGKMCSLLLGMGDKLDQVAASQSRLVQQLSGGAPSGDAAGRERGSSFQAGPGPGRGNVMQSTQPAMKTQGLEEEQAKRTQELKRQEEENKRRAAELAAKKSEAERRAKEEAERHRLEEERRREEAKKQKALLSEKTSGLMSGLMGGADNDNDLFSDGAPKKKKGGLFDDDD